MHVDITRLSRPFENNFTPFCVHHAFFNGFSAFFGIQVYATKNDCHGILGTRFDAWLGPILIAIVLLPRTTCSKRVLKAEILVGPGTNYTTKHRP